MDLDDENSGGHEEGMTDAAKVEPSARKKPQTHLKERALLQEQKSRNVSTAREAAVAPTKAVAPELNDNPWGFESDELTKQLQDMVLDYISNQPGVENYPPTVKSLNRKNNVKVRAMVDAASGGTLANIEKSMDVDMNQANFDESPMKIDSDGEDGEWVYDVYFREELKKGEDGAIPPVTNGNYGVLVISTSDDEQWWYENADDDSGSDVWRSDDEDSNAEEYYKNDYPDEESDNEFLGPTAMENDSDEGDYFDLGDSDGELGSAGKRARPGMMMRGRRGRGIYSRSFDDEEYDLENDSDVD